MHNSDIKNPKFYLRLYEAEGNTEGTSNLSTEYKLLAQPLSQSWDEGTGKFGDRPKNTNGCSWENRSNPIGGNNITWSNADGTPSYGTSYLSNDLNWSTQSFSYESPDVNMDVTDMVNKWLDSSISNYGLILKFSGSQETNLSTFGNLRFFSNKPIDFFISFIIS